MTIIILGVFMAILDTSVVNVAIPKMETALNANTSQIQWVVTAYMLVLGVLVPISGWLTEKFGHKKIFLFSLAAFTLGSALSGAAWSLSTIILFRILQAVGGALMQPVAMSMIFRIFPPNRRGMVMGIFGIAMMMAPAFGPAISGYLVDYWSWRFIFYINVPIGIVALILGTLTMHEFPHEAKGKFDAWGFILTIIGFGSLLYGFNEVPSHGWGSTEVMVFLAVGIISIILLVITELNVENPMIQLRLLKNYMFSMSLLLVSLISIALFAGIFFLPMYLQDIQGYTAVRTGLFMTPAALVSAVIMPISGRLFDRIGARPLGLVGMAIVTGASFGFTTLQLHTGTGTIQWLYILRSAGMGIAMMPLMTAGQNTVPIELTSQGTAMINTVRNVASSLGTAVLTTYMTTRTNIHEAQLSWQVTSTSASGHYLLYMQQLLQAHGMSLQAAKEAAATMMSGLIQQQSFTAGMDDAFMVSTILTAIAFVLIIFYTSKKERAIRSQRRNKPNAIAQIKPQPALE